jgi:hypothetical protein
LFGGTFTGKLQVEDKINLYNYVRTCEVSMDREDKNSLLKVICMETAEKVIVSKHGISTGELFNSDGYFLEQYQEEYNKLYDLIEDRLKNLGAGQGNSNIKSVNNHTTIYTTGAYLQPVKITGKDGRETWRWLVSGFNDDTYLDGNLCNPVETAEMADGLLIDG